MNEQGIAMNKQRWEELVEFAKESMYYFNDGASVSDEEVMVIISKYPFSPFSITTSPHYHLNHQQHQKEYYSLLQKQ